MSERLAFPVEIYVQILNDLPGRVPSSLRAVVSCLSASSALRAAALNRSVWRNLYHGRYTNCDDGREEARRELCEGDFRLVFIQRYTIDREALRALDNVRASQGDEQSQASRALVAHISFDVWDALELECMLPIPRIFRGPLGDDPDSRDVDAAPHALSRRFWARAMRGAIARSYAIQRWKAIPALGEDGSATFEDVLSGFSAFMDESPKESVRELDALANRCRQYILALGLELDHERAGYNLPALVEAIRDFMYDEGFGVATGYTFLHPLNQFPCHFLREGRSTTIPLPLIWVFAGICRRLGIQADPTNTPGKVLCHITSPDPQQSGDMLFDVCSRTTPPFVFSSRDFTARLAELNLSPFSSRDHVFPAALSTILRRAVLNIQNASRERDDDADPGIMVIVSGKTWLRTNYAANVASTAILHHAHFLNLGYFSVDLSSSIPAEWALDQEAVVEAVSTTLRGAKNDIAAQLAKIRDFRIQQRTDWLKTFVGQVVLLGGQLYCVLGWRIRGMVSAAPLHSDIQLVAASQDTVLSLKHPDFTGRAVVPRLTADVARTLRQQLACFDRFFDDAIIPREDGRGGRLVPSKEFLVGYPDDMEYGARWTEEKLKQAERETRTDM